MGWVVADNPCSEGGEERADDQTDNWKDKELAGKSSMEAKTRKERPAQPPKNVMLLTAPRLSEILPRSALPRPMNTEKMVTENLTRAP